MSADYHMNGKCSQMALLKVLPLPQLAVQQQHLNFLRVMFYNLNTPYDIFIQTDCGADGTSDYFGPLSFTTTALPPPSNDLLENAIAVVCDGNYTW